MPAPKGHYGPWVPMLSRPGRKRTLRHKRREQALRRNKIPEPDRSLLRTMARQADGLRHVRVTMMQRFSQSGAYGDYRWPFPWARYSRRG